ncbi:MAG TPA: SulP family inorganic anion transporter [Burkholderiales bacterium]
MGWLPRIFPFLKWVPMSGGALRADVVAGVTVALVLVPQSMAYAQLAGLPAHYGLYTALLPVLVGGLWGSSGQLATGPVAVVSLLTAAALTPLAAQGSAQYVALAIALTFLVGCMQLALGAFRLGFVVNFLSHPVIAGFTSAAAIIIALSQLNKLLGVPMPRSDVFLADVWGVLQQLPDTHWPTLAFGAVALAAMLAFRRFLPRWPGVLITVAVATAVSASIGFERSATGTLAQISDPEARALAADYLEAASRVDALLAERLAKQAELARTDRSRRDAAQHVAALNYEIELLNLRIDSRVAENRRRLRLLRKLVFEQATDAAGAVRFQPAGTAGSGGPRWRIASLDAGSIRFAGGGEVVGAIPAGLPELKAPRLELATLASLFGTALIISLIGFMEAISIAKAIAARTRQRLDANQELLGQGLANLAGSFTQCFPASGSFSRSAVSFQAGARTGLSSVVAAAIVMLTLLLLTPLLHHLPQAVLAAVIMMAVVSLVHLGAIRNAWRAQRHDGIAAALTFGASLALAPHLDLGILVGAGLSVFLYLYRTMRPRVAVLGRHADGTLRDAAVHGLPLSAHVVAVRFDGQLYFANVPYFEDSLLDVLTRFPKARQILVVADGINQIDASGDEVVRHLVERFKENGVTLAFSGLKKQVLDVLGATGTRRIIGEDNVFVHEDQALAALADRVEDPDFARRSFTLLPGGNHAAQGV